MTGRRRVVPAAEMRGIGVLLVLACADAGDPVTAVRADAGPSPAAATAGPSSAAPASCGGVEEPCCAERRFPCARGLWCDAAAGICREGSPDSPDAQLACRADADCPPERRCCSVGAQGTCQDIEPGASCALPDLALLVAGEGVTLATDVFDGSTPSAGGCVRPRGARRRLRVSAAVANLGAADIILGGDALLGPGTPAGDDFLVYSVLDELGNTVATSRGPLPCNTSDDPARPFSCALGALPAGALVPIAALECESLDVTGLAAGHYRVRVELAGEWPDADPSNGRVEIGIELPSSNPLDACPTVDNPLLGVYDRRECGWYRAPVPGDGTCRPGESLEFDWCGCSGYPMLRLCTGDSPCAFSAALSTASGPYGSLTDNCTLLSGTCPAVGRYNVLIATDDPAGVGVPCTFVGGTGS